MSTALPPSFTRFVIWSALAALVIAAPHVLAEGVLDTISNAAKTASSGWMTKSLEYATTLFFGLAALEFAWSAIQLTLKKSELSEIAVATLFKVMSIAFFAMLLIKAPEWVPAIMNSFVQAGQGVSGASNLSPSNLFMKGVEVAGNLATKGMNINNEQNASISAILTSGTGLGSWMLSAIIIGLSAIMIVLAFAIVAIQLFVALIESYIVIGGGALMLGFMGSRWTMNFGEKFFGYAVSVGIKLFALYLLVGFGDTLVDSITADLDKLIAEGKGVNLGDWLAMGGASVVFGGMGFMVPAMASSMMNGAPALSMSNLGAAAGSVAAAPIAGALAAGAAGLQGAGMVASMMQTSKAAGAIGGSAGGGSGAAGAISGLSKMSSPGGAGPSKPGGFSPGSGGSSGAPGAGPGLSKLATPGSMGGTTAPGGGKDAGQAPKPGGDPTKPGSQAGNATPGANAQGGGKGAGNPTKPGSQAGDGFAGPSPRTMTNETGGQSAANQDRQAPDAAASKGKGATLADKLFDRARDMQSESRRLKPHLVSDGQSGSGLQIRMGMGD